MPELRHTETNAGDDSLGRAFGLDGNLYLPVLLTIMGALACFALLGLVLKVNYLVAAIMVSVPLTGVLIWALGFKRGKPAGYDRDLLEYWISRGHFTKRACEQGGLLR